MSKKNIQQEGYLDFEAYERAKEPHTRQKASDWRTAIGLQDVDGLKVSDYLKQTAAKHIEGDITIDEARDIIRDYYVSKILTIGLTLRPKKAIKSLRTLLNCSMKSLSLLPQGSF